MESIQPQVTIKVLGPQNVCKDMSVAKDKKMTLAERRIAKKGMSISSREAGGKNQSDAITEPVKSFEKFPGIGVVRHGRAGDLGLRKERADTAGCGK